MKKRITIHSSNAVKIIFIAASLAILVFLGIVVNSSVFTYKSRAYEDPGAGKNDTICSPITSADKCWQMRVSNKNVCVWIEKRKYPRSQNERCARKDWIKITDFEVNCADYDNNPGQCNSSGTNPLKRGSPCCWYRAHDRFNMCLVNDEACGYRKERKSWR